MSTASSLTKAQEAQQRYYRARRAELLKEHPELTTKRAQLQRLRSEWNLLTPEERKTYEKPDKVEGVPEEPGEEVGVEEFLENVKQERKKDDIDPEYEEDEVLSIVNHKSKWKLTHGRKKKVRINYFANSTLRLN